MSNTKSTRPPETKTEILRKLLSRKSGADLATLQSATGWQAHSVRAALSGLRKAGFIIERAAPVKPGGKTIYRLGLGPESPR